MSVERKFRDLGAPLVNTRQSWGAVRPADGAVFLRVWQDECRREPDDTQSVQVLKVSGDDRFGRMERMRHLAMIRAGAPCYAVIVVDVGKPGEGRKIGNVFKDVFVGGALVDQPDGSVRLMLAERIPHAAAAQPRVTA